MRIKQNKVLWLAIFCACRVALGAGEMESVPSYPSNLEWWGDARFGMFVHWGPVSLKGTEIGWSRDPGPNGARGGSIPAAEYDALFKQFNPTNFSAREWVEVAKAAGMKYLVFTSKHHDGFCEFDSKLTDYKITSRESPFHRDVVKELADACRQAGLRFGLYYSQPDEHHPDYRTVNHARYLEYMRGQVRELLSHYGPISVLWFDGLGGSSLDWEAEKCFAQIRQLQPRILVNNRCGLPGDFDTPEQEIGKFQINRPWESCITICNQWAWKPGDEMKSLSKCLETLVRCAGGDGNLLFNVGPMPDGRIEPRQVARLREMGGWLAKYGSSIYGTRGGPWKPTSSFASTRKGNTIFVHVFRWKGEELVLPNLPARVVASALVTGGKVRVEQAGYNLTLSVVKEDQQALDTIVELSTDVSALAIPAINSVPHPGAKASASNIYHDQEDFSADQVLDENSNTRWATDSGIRQAWLQVDFEKPTKFSHVTIDEWSQGGKRIQSFELQFWSGDEWKTFHRGTTIGEKWEKSFAPKTTQRLRLNILEATEGPTINEFSIAD